MKKIKHNQLGFGTIEIILIVLIIAILGAVGWYVWNRNNSSSKSSNSNSNSINSTADNSTATNNINYVNIKEWGVRFPSASSGEFSYFLPTSGQGSTPESTDGGPADMQYVYINVKGFTKETNSCVEPDGTVSGFAQIYRHKDQNPTIQYATTHKLDPKFQVKLDGWYYSTNGLGESGNCFEGVTATQTNYTKLVSLFSDNFKKLEKN